MVKIDTDYMNFGVARVEKKADSLDVKKLIIAQFQDKHDANDFADSMNSEYEEGSLTEAGDDEWEATEILRFEVINLSQNK